MKFYATPAIIVAIAIILNLAQGQGYNPALYQGWSDTCICIERDRTKPGLLCLDLPPPVPPQSRDASTCSSINCIDECDSDLECPGRLECVRKCQPGMSDPLPPDNVTKYDSPGSIEKPGAGPASDPNRNCVQYYDQCKSDCECPESKKCCLQDDCGLECKEADKTGITPTCQSERLPSIKPGKCPTPGNMQCVTCNDACVSDCECKDNRICRQQPGCGNQCKLPISD